jgi:hypothetical protein
MDMAGDFTRRYNRVYAFRRKEGLCIMLGGTKERNRVAHTNAHKPVGVCAVQRGEEQE